VRKLRNSIVSAVLALMLTVSPLSVHAQREEESAASYTGEGIVVAVIDEGFDIDTSYFRLSKDTAVKLGKNEVREILPTLEGKGTYINPKVPYAYDYANETDVMSSNGNHGTHVAGIIGANGSKYKGTAPNAQLLLMKVFGDDGTSDEEDLTSAINDALLLGADVINLSIGILAGYADGSPFGAELKEAFSKAEEAGVTVVCAQGNGGRTGIGSYYSGIYGITDPTTSITDSGTTAAPASLDSVMAAGALVSPYTKALCFTLLEEAVDTEKEDPEVKGTSIRCTDSSYTYVEPIGQNLADRYDKQQLEYVPVGGLGRPEDFKAAIDSGLSFEGKLALIERGEITFAEKLSNAAEHGAIGAIVYDNAETEVYSLMQLDGAPIPGVFISQADGKLLYEAEYKYVYLKSGETGKFANTDAGMPASYTSWGVTPELTLKPDISAVGDNVESVIPGGDLSEISGTSQASAYVSGCAALWCEYLNSLGMVRGEDYDPAYIRALMMNTAKVNTSPSGGIENSPRVQGAGEVSADDVGRTELLITSESGKAKLELGDKLGESFTFTADITNITEETKEAEISAVLLGEGYTAYKITEGTAVEEVTDAAEKSDKLPCFVTGEMLAFDSEILLNGVNVNRYANENADVKVKIEPGKTVRAEFKVNIGKELYAEYSEIFEYGFFAEGYIYAETENTVSGIPYIGYSDDWAAVPIFDGELYQKDSFYRNTYLYTDVTFYDHRTLHLDLGQNIYEEDSECESSFLAFSPNGDKCAESINMSLDTLRSVKNAGFVITSQDGKVMFESGDREFMRKNYVDSGGLLHYSDLLLWGGRDQKNANYVYPDGIYTVTFYAAPAYDGAKQQTLSFDIVLDTKMPKLDSYEFITFEDGTTLLKLKVSDEYYLMGVSVYGMLYGDPTELNIDEPIATLDEPGAAYELLFDITGCDDRYIYIDILDYAYNLTTERIENINHTVPEI